MDWLKQTDPAASRVAAAKAATPPLPVLDVRVLSQRSRDFRLTDVAGNVVKPWIV